MNPIDKYVALLTDFMEGRIAEPALARAYFSTFQNETHTLGEPYYRVLNGVFLDLDQCTSNPDLLDRGSDFFIDEEELKRRISSALSEIERLQSPHLVPETEKLPPFIGSQVAARVTRGDRWKAWPIAAALLAFATMMGALAL